MYDDGGTYLKYLPNLGINDDGQGVFGLPRTIVTGLSKLDESKSRTSTLGVDANVLGILGAGKSWSKTRTSTEGYFNDFNGDGLMDVVRGGRVKFNRTESWDIIENSDVEFGNFSHETPNPITPGAIDQSLETSLELESLEELRAEHPQFDHIKAWKAPYTGLISITGIADLLQANDCNFEGENNVFRLTIEKALNNQQSNNTSTLLSRDIRISGPTSASMNLTHSISKGQTLFFRIHNRNNGCGGTVKWNPEIVYNPNANIPNDENENNRIYRDYSATEDFMKNNGGGWVPGNEDTSLSGINFNVTNETFDPYQFSDDIKFVIERTKYTHYAIGHQDEGQINESETDIITVYKTYNHKLGTISATEGSLGSLFNLDRLYLPNYINGKYSYAFRVYVESDSNVDWEGIDWSPTFTNQNGEIRYPSVTYYTYDNNVNQSNYQTYGNTLPNVTITDPDEEDDRLITISHNMFSGLDYSAFNDIPDDKFPIKVNWVIKQELNNDVSVINAPNPIVPATFYVQRGCTWIPWPINDHVCTYYFTTTADPDDGFVLSEAVNFNTYFKHYLTKEDVAALNADSSSKLYTALYIDNAEFALNNPSDVTIALHEDQQGSGYTFNTVTIDAPFMAMDPAFYGLTYRGWGEFLYNGGVTFNYDEEGNIPDGATPIHFDGNIDMSVFDHSGLDQNDASVDEDDIDDMGINDSSVRYALYGQDNPNNSYINSAVQHTQALVASHGFTSGQLITQLGRFGEYNIYELYADPNEIFSETPSILAGLKQRSISKGKSTSGNITVPLGENPGDNDIEISGSSSNGASKLLNQYVDINGDRYPDLVTKSDILYTNMQGRYTDLVKNDFVSGK